MNLGAGFHSEFTEDPFSVHWVQIDLGKEYSIDTIALVPTYVRRDDANVWGYGFPRQFYIEVSNDPNFETSTRIYETPADAPNPGKYPLLIPGVVVRGRYIRLTCTELAMEGDHAFFALGEMIVLSGMRNVALWRPLTASDTEEAELRWSIEYLVDEISLLPLSTYRQLSPTDGFQSKAFDDVEQEIEVVVDLGQVLPVDEVRLVPALPLHRPDIPGWGFPVDFQVDLLQTLDDSEPVVIYDSRNQEFRHSMHRPMVIPVASREYFLRQEDTALGAMQSQWELPAVPVDARYVRIRAKKLDGRIRPYYFALAELQVYSGSINVARDRPVSVSAEGLPKPGSREKSSSRWDPSYLTDGFGSRRRLMELSQWLFELEELRLLEARSTRIDGALQAAVADIWRWFVWSVGILMSTALAFVIVYNSRLRYQYRRHAERLRNQIASDLHDDIGSNLGTIGLLCESVSKGQLTDQEKRSLVDIREIAVETSDAMRDILWIIDPASTRLEDFVGRLRSVTNRLLTSQESVFTVPESLPECAIPLAWRRNMFLSVKEVLHNAAKHSQCETVKIAVVVERNRFDMRIQDDGVGFDLDARSRGFGIRNVRRRLRELGGVVKFEPVVGEGTTVLLQAPLPLQLSTE
jgi:signal transduction histidine kinase